MSEHRTFESELLEPAEILIRNFVQRHSASPSELRFQILEAAAARLGGFSLDDFNNLFETKPILATSDLLTEAKRIVEALNDCGIAPSLALSALARETVDKSVQRSSGAYHTDFRLAQRLAGLVDAKTNLRAKIIDPACGAGILLVALSIEVCGHDRRKMARWLSECVYASDQSERALRGALLSLASLTSDLKAIHKMRAKWRVCDSLLANDEVWKSVAPKGFDVVIANPPWEKVKLSRHEFLKSKGHERHYGEDTNGLDNEAYGLSQADVAKYAERLIEKYPLLTRGEPDLYAAFTELFAKLCKAGGTIAALVPGGLIRSQGTEALRRYLFDISSDFAVSIFENRARFFAIDTRFKFLAIRCTKRQGSNSSSGLITVRHERGSSGGLEVFGHVKIGRRALAAVRPDLSIPEVKNKAEWAIYCRMVDKGEAWSDPQSSWHPVFCREVDMTNDRRSFRPSGSKNLLPVIEGRMVQQHRFGAKEYVGGTGRRAIWRLSPLGSSNIAPQFYISDRDISPAARARVTQFRGGFCDITGQTNERSVMATIIPAGVVCGNKVPTVLFPNDPSEERLLVWSAIMNSLPFDWIARRVITTTINYFLLISLPLPKLVKNGLPWSRIVTASKALQQLDTAGSSLANLIRAAELRASIDAEIAVAYGLDMAAVRAMMGDFPLIDRSQPPLPGEERSTITKDLVLSATAKRMRVDGKVSTNRVESAFRVGALAYIPSEFGNETTQQLRNSHAGKSSPSADRSR